MRTRLLDIIYSAIFLATGAFLYWTSFGEEVAGRPISQDPVWYPRVLLILSLAMALILLIRGVVKRSTDKIPTIRWKTLAASMIVVGLYLALLEKLGFIPVSLVLISTMSWFLGFHRLWVIAAVAVGFTIAVWYGFNDLLSVTPPGLTLPSLRSAF